MFARRTGSSQGKGWMALAIDKYDYGIFST